MVLPILRIEGPYRDWLIDAFNSGKPFDQLTTEMLAGDLLPDTTDWQRLATGFHRNHRTNGEGGSIAEELHREVLVETEDGQLYLGLARLP